MKAKDCSFSYTNRKHKGKEFICVHIQGTFSEWTLKKEWKYINQAPRINITPGEKWTESTQFHSINLDFPIFRIQTIWWLLFSPKSCHFPAILNSCQLQRDVVCDICFVICVCVMLGGRHKVPTIFHLKGPTGLCMRVCASQRTCLLEIFEQYKSER